jgi:seryl-tRNA(Sec) selenium transferase
MKFQQNQKLNSANVDIINNFSDAMSTNNGASTMASEALEAAKPIIKNQFDAFDKAIPDR